MLTLRYGFCIILVLMVTGCSWLKPNPETTNDHHPVSECRNKPKNPWKEVKNLFCKALGTCQEVKLLVSHPAEVDLSKYKTVAFAKIDGDYGNSFATALKERMVQNGNLTVMDRTELDKVLAELQMTQDDLFDTEKREQVGKILPATALVLGKVEHKFASESRQKNATCGSGKKAYPCMQTYQVGTADMIADISIVRVETGQTIQVKHLSATSEETTDTILSTKKGINERALHEKNLNQLVSGMQMAILPYKSEQSVIFYLDGDLPQLERAIPDTEAGELQKAKERIRSAIADNKDNPKISKEVLAKAYFDLGLLYLYTQEFEQAEKAFETVDDLDLNKYPTGKMRKLVKCMEQEEKKKTEQTVAR